MMVAWLLGTFVAALLLALASAVQLLYLESLRLRSRDLPSLEFFKSTLEPGIGMKTDEGALSFSLIKHSMLAIMGVLILADFLNQTLTWAAFFEASITSLILMLVASYGVPQITYRRTKGRWLAPLVPVLRVLGLIIRPASAFLAFFYSLVEMADDKNGTEEQATPAENIDALISAGTEEGLIQEEDRKLIQSVVEFGAKVVREVMTPRPNIVAISADSTLEELRQLVINEQYSRIPIYEQSIDQIVGFVHVRDMFEVDEEERARRRVQELARSIRFVPETKPVNDLMREMQQDGAHLVIVVDEYGNTAGLASMEDLVEVILGEIRDEHEPGSDVTPDGAGGYIVSGNFDLGRLIDLFEFRPAEDVESTTIGGLVTEWLGRVPQRGEFVERDKIRVEVLASDELRVEQVRLSRSEAVAHE
ncbi:MAG: HlyC/CorC family transporter [Acidobacteria bacterium]|nr:MAG: HlyC/CorC family transporter [Acidobacteriota bacterium]